MQLKRTRPRRRHSLRHYVPPKPFWLERAYIFVRSGGIYAQRGRFCLLEAQAFKDAVGKTKPMEHNIDLAGLPLCSYDVACGRASIVAILELIGNRIDRNATDL